MKNSRCQNLYKISLKHEAKFSQKSPCTNILLRCPLCPKVSDAVWKYNLQAHISKIHPTADNSIYSGQWSLSEEETTPMKACYLAKPCKSKKKSNECTFNISEVHSTWIALQLVFMLLAS
jgi:hypothetical protein